MLGMTFTRKQTLGVLFCSLFLLLIYMSYQVTDPATGRTVLGNVLFTIFSPVESVITAGYRGVAGVVGDYFNLVHTNRENDRLKREVSELKIRLAIRDEQARENERLRRILGLKGTIPYRQITGEVIGRDAKSPLSGSLITNRGSRHGIRTEMPVISVDGVVGMTVVATPFTSQVQLITDPSASIGAMLQKNRVAGILSGLGSGRCLLRFLPVSQVITPGDVVVTSGQDSLFPVGLLVGKVVRQIEESQYYRSAEVEAFQNFTSIEEIVFLSMPSVTAVPNRDKAEQP